ncbi:Curli production assembly/transport component CsgG [Turneriella parva DSM 21527]|uniref:Curli production assembly/transport component CsgG n=1 Tax=Turneriella parva (strain ATCC BAA-1111 / DSM 21527 / NCTC 11395 / H) TaxID=869212 RepID=I4B561_TURPD|nr:Curli production assembly/transport component CsgG [Turneriella parva DSM 21527]
MWYCVGYEPKGRAFHNGPQGGSIHFRFYGLGKIFSIQARGFIRQSRIIFTGIICCFLPLLNIVAQQPSIARRVLILDFVNRQKNVNAEYLSVTIAEALIDPLKKTRKFEILPRSTADKILKERNISKEQTFSEETAIQIGEATGADVVVMGSFVAVEPTVQIQAKAVDVAEKRLALSKSRTAKLDAKIFDNINALADDMTQEMAEKLPPLTQRVVYQDSGLFIAKDFIFHGMANAAVTWGFESKFLALGLGGSFNTSFKFLHRFVQPYFATSFALTTGKTQIDKMSAFDFSGGLTYAFIIPKKWGWVQETQIRPYVAGGAAAGTIKTSYDINYMVPAVSGGFITDFFVHKNLSIAVQIQQQFLFDADTTLKLLSVGLGAGYRI